MHVRVVQSLVNRTCRLCRAMLNARAERLEPWFSVIKTLVCGILVLAHNYNLWLNCVMRFTLHCYMAAPKLLNYLPLFFTNICTVISFKKSLKTHLFLMVFFSLIFHWFCRIFLIYVLRLGMYFWYFELWCARENYYIHISAIFLELL